MINEALIFIIIILLMADIVSTWWAVRLAKTVNIETNALMRFFMKRGYLWSVLISFIGIGILVYIFKYSGIVSKVIFIAFMVLIIDNNSEYIIDYNKDRGL